MERESLGSTFVSLGGIWIGLGAGLIFLFASVVVATTGMRVHGGDAEQAKLLFQAVSEQVVSTVSAGVEVRDEGRKVVFQKSQAKGKPVSVTLLFDPDSGVVSKVVNGSSLELAKLKEVKFHHSAGRLFVKCEAPNFSGKKSWATSRWKAGSL